MGPAVNLITVTRLTGNEVNQFISHQGFIWNFFVGGGGNRCKAQEARA